MNEKELSELKSYTKFIREKYGYIVPEFQEILDEVENDSLQNYNNQSLHFKNGRLFYK